MCLNCGIYGLIVTEDIVSESALTQVTMIQYLLRGNDSYFNIMTKDDKAEIRQMYKLKNKKHEIKIHFPGIQSIAPNLA